MNIRQQKNFLNLNETKILKFLALFILLINSIAFFFPILRNDDPVLYATIAKNMVLSGDWVRLVFNNQPWLDKPHFPFWLTAISFKIFGINSFAYILPGFLFNLIGAVYTYKLANYLYDNKNIALMALIIYLTAIHLLLSNSLDLRAEAYLLGEITPAVYYWLRYSNIYEMDPRLRWDNSLFNEDDILLREDDKLLCRHNNLSNIFKYLVLGAIFTACAMMTKGLFTIVTISTGVISLFIYNKKWREILSLKWLSAILLSFILIAPEIISLYLQFDLRPNLVVFNHTNVSGIKWFFWGSQFGRFFDSGQIAVSHVQPFHYLFFIHTFLWAFLPWSLIFCWAIFLNIQQRQRNSRNTQNFVFLCGCFLPTFILFSLTKFQLDHYTNILMPYAAILSASMLYNIREEVAGVLFKIQLGLSIILIIAGTVLWQLVFNNSYVYTLFITVILLSWHYTAKYSNVFKIIFYSATTICAVFIVIVFTLGKYDSKYDAGYNMALKLNDEAMHLPVMTYNVDWVTFRFYYLGNYTKASNLENITKIKTPYYLVFNNMDQDQIKALKLHNLSYVTTVKGNTIDRVLKHILNKAQLENNLITYEVLKVN